MAANAARRSAGGVALKFVSRLSYPTIIAAMTAALIATADIPAKVPLACGVTWTRVGGTTIFMPDCPRQSPPSQPAPNEPPLDEGSQPPPEPPAAN